MSLISQAVPFIHDRDPAEVIWDEVRDHLPGYRIGGPDVLIATYLRKGGRTAGGILLADRTVDEDKYQGVSGLVLALGAYAYKTEKTSSWFVNADGEPANPKVGDWVQFDVKLGRSFLLGKTPCRLIDDQHVDAVLAHPDMVA